MTLGTGVFLGAALFALVYLFVNTRDRWHWKRIALIAALVLIAPFIAVGIYLGYDQFKSVQREKPRRVNSYADVTIGMPKIEVVYQLGRPTHVLGDVEGNMPRGFRPVQEVDAKSLDFDGMSKSDSWEYVSDYSGRVDIDFSSKSADGVVTQIGCYSRDPLKRCPDVFGVSSQTDEADIVKLLGEPSRTKLDPETAVKTLTFDDLNVQLLLIERRVYLIRVGILPDAA